jgi:hypothetical protein
MRSNPPDRGQTNAGAGESQELLKEVRELIQLLNAERAAKKASEKKAGLQ